MNWIDTERKSRVAHRCFLCGCTIEVGTQYIHQFVPEYKSANCMHKECQELISHEGFYDEDSCEGTSEDFFCDVIFDYVNKHHLSSDGEAYDEGWDAPIYEQVKLILKELED